METIEKLIAALGQAKTLLELAGACPVGDVLRQQMRSCVEELTALGVEGKEPVLALDTFNRLGVTAHQGKVVSVGMKAAFSPAEALQLAAWLIVGAELCDRSHCVSQVVATVEAIHAT